MPAMIPSLWPQDIKLEVLSPLYILKSQVRGISEATRGILDAAVTTVSGEGDFVTHRLDLIPTQLDGSRHRILSATHRESLYPVVVEAEVFRPKRRVVPNPIDGIIAMSQAAAAQGLQSKDTIEVREQWPSTTDWRPVASSQEEFTNRVREVLQSPQVRAVIDSLLARSYEKTVGATNGTA